jgi:hypothetical protein
MFKPIMPAMLWLSVWIYHFRSLSHKFCSLGWQYKIVRNLSAKEKKSQITKYKLQTNHNPKITNYKQRGVLRTDFKRHRRGAQNGVFYLARQGCL